MAWDKQEFEKKYKPQVDTPLDPFWNERKEICERCKGNSDCMKMFSYFGKPMVSDNCEFVTELAICGVVVIEREEFFQAMMHV